MPDALVVEPQSATLLGSPLGNVESISLSICDKTALLQVMGERLKYLCTHDSLLLLRNAFAIPKLMYLLRTSPCFLSPSLQLYDNELRNMLSSITNTFLDDRAWLQASLPVKSGGLIGIRSAVHLAPSAYLASFVGCRELTFTILPPRFQESPLSLWDSAIAEWSTGHNESPSGPMSHRQKLWDLPRVSSIAAELLATAPDPLSKARLLSALKESGSWLHILTVTSLGLRMDDNTIRIAIGLRLGTPLCIPHLCYHCGANVDTLGTHGLSCRFSAGRHFRHAMLNDILHRALSSANVPSRLEPTGLDRTDGKRPDGITMVPWSNGRLLVWDATCVDTFAPSHLSMTASEVCAAANQAEQTKIKKYSYITSHAYHSFTPVAFETTGVCGPRSMSFLTDLGRRIVNTTGEKSSLAYLLQKFSVTIQRGNAASILGTLPPTLSPPLNNGV